MCTDDKTQSAEEPGKIEPMDISPERADEITVDLGTELADTGDTIPEEAEYLGSYRSIPEYLRAMLEPEVTPGCAWILEYLDYQAVRRRWENDGSRLVLERGQVYRIAADDEI